MDELADLDWVADQAGFSGTSHFCYGSLSPLSGFSVIRGIGCNWKKKR